MMSFWVQIGELVGISAVVSTVVNTALEQYVYKKERMAIRLEEHLKYSVENYPRFAMILDRINDTLVTCHNNYNLSLQDKTNTTDPVRAREDFNREVFDLLYFLGSLFELEQQFQSKQGQMFRLTSQTNEKVAAFFFRFIKNDMFLSPSQCVYLAQSIKDKSLKEYRNLATKQDPELQRIIEESIKPALQKEMVKYVTRELGTLSRLLISEIDYIRLPGYKRKRIPLSLDDQEYLKLTERIPQITLGDYVDYPKPIQIQIYNNWDHEIIWGKEEVQFKVYRVMDDGSEKELTPPLIIFDPEDQKQKKSLRIKPGQTLRAEWVRPDDENERTGKWKIHYLPDPNQTFSSVVFDWVQWG